MNSPKMLRYPPLVLSSHRHICAIPHFAAYRAITVRYPIKTSTKEFCNTIAAGIARFEKYRGWASKCCTSEPRLSADISSLCTKVAEHPARYKVETAFPPPHRPSLLVFLSEPGSERKSLLRNLILLLMGMHLLEHWELSL